MTQLAAYLAHDQKDQEFMLSERDRNIPTIVSDDIVVSAIAMLSDKEINRMSRRDLLDTVKAARAVPRFSMDAGHLAMLDNDYLRRVVYTVRCCMRSRCNEQSLERGLAPYFQIRFLKQRSVNS